MKAIHFKNGGGKASEVLEIQELPKPEPETHDLLVRIEATSVNPADTKARAGGSEAHEVTGFDAAGVVEAVGSGVGDKFKVGDEVYYAGVFGRQGTMAQYSLVDYRIAALKPKKLDWVHASSVPLVSLTGWEMLEENFGLEQDDPKGVQGGKSILIINGAGGVGSITTQLARHVFKLGRVIVTASRKETIEHAQKMGATHTINHRKDLKDQLKSIVGIDTVEYIFICFSTNDYMDVAVDIAAPRGKIGSIVGVGSPLQGMHKPAAMSKALSFSWEWMFSKGKYNTNLESQGVILAKVAKLYDEGVLKSMLTDQSDLSVATLIQAHEKLESGKAIGKIAFKVGDDIS